MAAPVVVDASVVAAFLLREPEAAKFDSVLLRVINNEIILHVPALFFFELLNILAMAERNKRITNPQRHALTAELEAIPFSDDSPPGASTRQRIAALAHEHRLTAYDAAYLELADRLHATLVTLDTDLLRLHKTYRWIN